MLSSFHLFTWPARPSGTAGLGVFLNVVGIAPVLAERGKQPSEAPYASKTYESCGGGSAGQESGSTAEASRAMT